MLPRSAFALRATARQPSFASLNACGADLPSRSSRWACLDSNQESDRYERGEHPESLNIFNDSRARLFVFMRVCSRDFCGISGGRQPPDQPESGMAQKARKSPVGVEADNGSFK